MGLFDRVRCRYPLPDPVAQDLEYQSKSTPAQYLHQYEITPDGERFFFAMELVEGAPLSTVCDALTRGASSATAVDLPAWRQALSAACAEAAKAERPLGGPATTPETETMFTTSAGAAARKPGRKARRHQTPPR